MKTKDTTSEKLISQQLFKVCSSNELRLKYRLCELLKYLVNETLAGRSEQIKNYSIGLDIFKRSEDFNPELDPIVRIEVGRLRNSLNKYYLGEGKNDLIRIFIRKGNYIPTFILQEDLQLLPREKEEEKKETNLSFPLLPSVIVFPFTNLTGDANQEFFVQGFAEELSLELSCYEDIKLMRYNVPINHGDYFQNRTAIIESLGARFLVEGNVRKDKSKIKVGIVLTDASTSEQLWAEQFKFNLTAENLITVQEDIARETIFIIANEFGIIPQKMTNDSRNKRPVELETYEAMLRYYYYQTRHTTESASAAFTALEQAVIKEPENGTAIAMLASIYGSRYLLDVSDGKASINKMIELSEKAVSLEPNNQFTRIVHAWTYFVLEKKDLFLLEIDYALSLRPKSPFRIGAIGFFLSLYGEWERGKLLLDEAMSHSVGFPGWYYGATTLYYYRLGEFEKAYEQAVSYNVKGVFWGPMLRSAVLGQLNRISEAKKEISELKAMKPGFETKAQNLIGRYVKEETLVAQIIEGLQKAGLKIGIEKSINN